MKKITVAEIKADLEWRIKDYKSQQKYWYDLLIDLPDEKVLKEQINDLFEHCRKKGVPPTNDIIELNTQLHELPKKNEEYRTQCALYMARLDSLERFYNLFWGKDK